MRNDNQRKVFPSVTIEKMSWKNFVSKHGPVIIVALMAVAVYARTFGYELVWDDPLLLQFIREQVHEGGLGCLLTSKFFVENYYRPVVLFSLWFDSLLEPLFSPVYHVSNVILHVVISVFVFRFIRSVSDSEKAAFWGSALFAVHPVHCESVAFVSGRTDLLAAFFVMICGVLWAQSRHLKLIWPLYIVGSLSFFLAILSKEAALMLPVVFLVWDFIDGKAAKGIAGWWERNRFWVVGWSAALGVGLFTRLVIADVSMGIADSRHVLWNLSWLKGKLALMPNILAAYSRLLTIPWPLSAYYTRMDVRLTFLSVMGFFLLLSAVVFLFRRNVRMGVLSLIWIIGFLGPALGFLFFSAAIIAERFLYLPSVGFAVLCGVLIADLTSMPNLKRWTRGFAVVLGLMFMAATVLRCGVWKNQLTLFSDMVKTSPFYWGAHDGLGTAYRDAGRLEEAIEQYQTAVRLSPDRPGSYINLGLAYYDKGDYEKTIAQFLKAIKLDPEDPLGYNNLAWVYATVPDPGLREVDEAIRLATKAYQMSGGKNPLFIDTLGVAYAEAGRFSEAIALNQQALVLARKIGLPSMAEEIESHIELFKKGKTVRTISP